MKPEPKLQDTAVGLDGELYRPAHTPQTGKSLSDYDTLKSKESGAFQTVIPEYHFSVNLPLGLAIDTLHDHVEAFNTGLPTEVLKCETSQLDSDRAKFTLATRDAHKTGVKLTGTMQRWEGDRTRIDVDVVLNTSSQVRTQHQLSDSSNTSMTIIILFGVMLMFFRVLGDRNFWSPGTIPQLLVLMGVLIVALRIFPMEAKRRARSKADRALFTAQRSADGLTGLLVEAFTQYDVQWIPSKPS